MPEILREPVQSSTIRSVGYDAESETLAVEFLSGAVYAYDGVPAGVAEGLRTAPSVGAYHAAHVKRAGFAFRRLS